MTVAPCSPGQPFCFAVVPDLDEVVVVLTGELDLASADVLEREVRTLRMAAVDRVVVDLRQVEFMDSTGLRVLIGLCNTATREGHQLTIVPGPRQVQRIFDLTATRGLFDWREP